MGSTFQGRPGQGEHQAPRQVLRKVLIGRTRCQDALIESQQSYKRLFDSAQVGILILDASTGQIERVNPYLCQLLGYEATELIGLKHWQLGVSNDKQNWLNQLREAQIKQVAQCNDLPLITKNGRLIDVESVFTSYEERETLFIQSNIRNISGLKAAERMTQNRQAEVAQSLNDMVAALVSLCETRDPYTVSHQRRVSDLAVVIGAELGLNSNQLEELRISSLVHDIGKFSIPTELLIKPTALKPEEIKLLRTHAQAGYEVLRPIHFPWPVAEAVLQHHERLDGSGYPQGLRGNAIGLWARIIAVADQVEAMATDRPYRFAPGIEAALTELEAGRGRRLDPTVVDICLRLFRDQGYKLLASAR